MPNLPVAKSVPEHVSSIERRFLYESLPAIQIIAVENGKARVGPMTRLGGVTVEIWGEGFDDETVKICYADAFYFIFRQDLERAWRLMSATA